MIGIKVKTRADVQKVLRAERRNRPQTLGHAGAFLRRAMQWLMRSRKGPSKPGASPHAHTKALKRAILYAVEADCVVIGPSYDLVDDVGRAHEHGGLYRGAEFDKRPFAAPALENNRDRLPALWEGAVKT